MIDAIFASDETKYFPLTPSRRPMILFTTKNCCGTSSGAWEHGFRQNFQGLITN